MLARTSQAMTDQPHTFGQMKCLFEKKLVPKVNVDRGKCTAEIRTGRVRFFENRAVSQSENNRYIAPACWGD